MKIKLNYKKYVYIIYNTTQYPLQKMYIMLATCTITFSIYSWMITTILQIDFMNTKFSIIYLL